MSLLPRLSNDVVLALKSRDSVRVSTLRMLISAIKYAAIDSKDMSEHEEFKVLMSEIKKRREAVAAYEKVSPERAATEHAELEILEAYMPTGVSDDDIRALITQVRIDNPSLATGPLMGKVMAVVKSKGWMIEGGKIKTLVEEN